MQKPLVIDNGLYTNLAAKMAETAEVAYYSSWHNSFPTSREFAPGTGLPNVERVDDPITFMLEGKASHVIVPDLYLGGFETLARQLGIPSWGCNGGSEIETDRWFLKQFLSDNNLPVGYAIQIEGIDGLAEHLQENKNKYVKVSTYRGDLETVHHRNWDASEASWFSSLKHRLGIIGKSMNFIVEDPIPDALEIGIDTFVRNGRFDIPALMGVENKDSGYFGFIVDELPEALGPLVSVLSGYFQQHKYQNFFSNEMRITKDGTIYMTDATCRVPSPPGGVMMAAIRNLNDVILNDETPDYGDARYCYEIVLKSDVVAKDFLQVEFPKKFADRYAFHNHCVRDGKVWIIPHDSQYVEFGSALGWGASKDDAREMCEEAADALEADGIRFDKSSLKAAEKEIEKKGGFLGITA